MTTTTSFTSSSRTNPCPICGRTKDGDCRIADELVCCHHGSSHSPPDGLKKGQTVTGKDGRTWAYTGETQDGRCASFKVDRPRPGAPRGGLNGHRPQPPAKAMAAAPTPRVTAPQGPIRLLHLSGPAQDVVELNPDGKRTTLRHQGRTVEVAIEAAYRYSASQLVRRYRLDGDAGKTFRAYHRNTQDWAPKAGPTPWPAWRQNEAIAAAKQTPDRWLLEVEGEKAAEIARQGSRACISQPGHAHTSGDLRPRYEALKAAGVAGVVFLADNDAQGLKRALQAQQAAQAAALQLVILPAVEVWPQLPQGGSIDDAPGTPTERGQTIEEVVATFEPHDWAEVLTDWQQRLGVVEEAAATPPSSNAESDRPRRRSELLADALDALIASDEDAHAEAQAELMGRFRMTGSQVQAALFRLLTQRSTDGRCRPGPGAVDITAVRQLDHLVPGFVAEKEQTLIHAPKGTGKTLAALAIGGAVVTGTPLLDRGEAPRQGKVLYLATDSGCESMAVQMQELGLLELPEFQHGHPAQRFFIRGHSTAQGITAWEATIPEIIWLLRFVQDNQIDLVVIDSAKACLSLTDADYTDNKAVGALLTLFQRVVCPHVSVVWLHHDGRESGHNAGAKAWAEIPVMVHRIERVEEPKGRSAFDAPALPKGARRWVCVKSRIPGDERDFTYTLTGDGELQVTAEVEIVGSCHEAVIEVLSQALLQGREGLATDELLEEVTRKHGRGSKTVRNTLSQLRRRRQVVAPRRGRWSLAPALAERASRAHVRSADGNGNEEEETPVIDRDLSMSRQCPDGTNRDIRVCPDPNPSGQRPGCLKPQAGQGISACLSRNPGESAHPYATSAGTDPPALPTTPGPRPAPSMTDTTPTPAQPDWLPLLRRLVQERPNAAAFTLALALEQEGGPRLTGAQVKPWLDRTRAEKQEGAAGLSQEGMGPAAA